LKKIRDPSTRNRVARFIEKVETANTLRDVPNLTKMSGSGSFYPARLGDYRVGIHIAEDTVEFVRFLHRRDIYRFFP
jgi:mRNA interferase RelE/StbE